MPTIWDEFKRFSMVEFIPSDHIRRSSDKLRKLFQKTDVARYLAEFHNILLTILSITDEEMFDGFITGIKYEVGPDVLKIAVSKFEETSIISIQIDSAIRATVKVFPVSSSSSIPMANNGGPVPM